MSWIIIYLFSIFYNNWWNEISAKIIKITIKKVLTKISNKLGLIDKVRIKVN